MKPALFTMIGILAVTTAVAALAGPTRGTRPSVAISGPGFGKGVNPGNGIPMPRGYDPRISGLPGGPQGQGASPARGTPSGAAPAGSGSAANQASQDNSGAGSPCSTGSDSTSGSGTGTDGGDGRKPTIIYQVSELGFFGGQLNTKENFQISLYVNVPAQSNPWGKPTIDDIKWSGADQEIACPARVANGTFQSIVPGDGSCALLDSKAREAYAAAVAVQAGDQPAKSGKYYKDAPIQCSPQGVFPCGQ